MRRIFRASAAQHRKQHRLTGTRSFARTHARTKRIRFPGRTHPPTSDMVLGLIVVPFLIPFSSFSLISASLFQTRFWDRFSLNFHVCFNLSFFGDVRFTYEKPMIFNMQAMIFMFFRASRCYFCSLVVGIICSQFFHVFSYFFGSRFRPRFGIVLGMEKGSKINPKSLCFVLKIAKKVSNGEHPD